MKYCIVRGKINENTAGIKAPDDINRICKKIGFETIRWAMFPSGKSWIYKKIWLSIIANMQWLKIFCKVNNGDLLLYQHPSYAYRLAIFWIDMVKRKNVRTVALIHDLESLRKGITGHVNYNPSRSRLSDEVLLKRFDSVICHNEHMRKYMIEQGFDPNKLVNLEIFDYLTDTERKQPEKGDIPSIAIAGNLAIGKCAYIYNIVSDEHNSGLQVHLYGINFQDDKATDGMIYHGSFKPDELPGQLEGDFGLVWDGNSAETCAGNTGEYLKYNNPHKTSLYLASGMPVIVWSQAAIADFVIENGVGFAVDSLYEMEDKINRITKEEYEVMLKKSKIVGKKIRNGFYTKKCLEKIQMNMREEL